MLYKVIKNCIGGVYRMDLKDYEAKMREILDREVNTDEDCIRQVDELMMLDAQYLLSNI